jgi:hypothetical protein
MRILDILLEEYFKIYEIKLKSQSCNQYYITNGPLILIIIDCQHFII